LVEHSPRTFTIRAILFLVLSVLLFTGSDYLFGTMYLQTKFHSHLCLIMSIYYSKTTTLSTDYEFSWILLDPSIGCIFRLLRLLLGSICRNNVVMIKGKFWKYQRGIQKM